MPGCLAMDHVGQPVVRTGVVLLVEMAVSETRTVEIGCLLTPFGQPVAHPVVAVARDFHVSTVGLAVVAVAHGVVREEFSVARTVAAMVHHVVRSTGVLALGRVSTVVAVAAVVCLVDGAADVVVYSLLSFQFAPVAVATVVAAVAVATVVAPVLSSVVVSLAVVVPSAFVEPVAR